MSKCMSNERSSFKARTEKRLDFIQAMLHILQKHNLNWGLTPTPLWLVVVMVRKHTEDLSLQK